MRSAGTKETQGINGDASALQRKQDAILRFAGSEEACPYPLHRDSDWRLIDSPHVVCGVCHPPAKKLRGVVAA